MEEVDIIQRLTSVEDRAKSNSKRIDTLDSKVEDIHELATSVKLLASETKAMREDVNDMNNRLKIVEDKPLREYEETRKQVKNNVIAFVCGIVLTVLAMRIRIIKIFIIRRKNYDKSNESLMAVYIYIYRIV